MEELTFKIYLSNTTSWIVLSNGIVYYVVGKILSCAGGGRDKDKQIVPGCQYLLRQENNWSWKRNCRFTDVQKCHLHYKEVVDIALTLIEL